MTRQASECCAFTLFACLLLGATLSVAQPSEECAESSLGYTCMKTLADYITVHWTVGGTGASGELLGGEVPQPEDGQIAFALVGQTSGYVGFGFTEDAGSMFPARLVVGWMDGDESNVQSYEAVTQWLTEDDRDSSVEMENVFASEEDGVTTVAYTITTSSFPLDLKFDEEMDIIFTVGDADALEYHGAITRGSGVLVLGESKEPVTAETPAAGQEEPKEEPENFQVLEQEEGQRREEPQRGTSQVGSVVADRKCKESSLPGYQCEQLMPGDMVTLHWVIGPVQSDGDGPSPGEGEISMAMVGETEGWVGFAFTEASQKMNPSDTIVGWVTPDGEVVAKAYRLTSRNISPGDEDKSVVLTGVAGEERNGSTTIEFTRKPPSFLPDFEGMLSINVAVGDADALEIHRGDERWSADIDLLTGASVDTTKNLVKFYNWHAGLMMGAWLFMVPIGVIFSSHKWLIPIGGQGGWFQAHRVFQTLAIVGMIVGFVIALVEFDEHDITVARVHRFCGYIIFSWGSLQGLAGYLRPGKDSSMRPIFNIFHRYGGFALANAGPATVLLGIFSYDDILGVDLVQWLTPAFASFFLFNFINSALFARRSTTKP